MPGQYWATKYGAHAEQDYYLDEYHQYVEIDRQRPMPIASLGSNTFLSERRVVLKMLQQYLGPQRFWAAIHYYLVHHALGTALTEDVREAVLQTSGENLAWFWKEWFYEAGMPKLTVTAAYDSAAQRVTLSVRQHRAIAPASTVQTAPVGCIRSPRSFGCPSRFGSARRGAMSLRTPSCRRSSRPMVVDGVHSAPTMAIFDDGNGLLKALTFEEPTAWLATELRRDTNLWDRSWTIEQLSHRQTDSVAAARSPMRRSTPTITSLARRLRPLSRHSQGDGSPRPRRWRRTTHWRPCARPRRPPWPGRTATRRSRGCRCCFTIRATTFGLRH